MKIPTVKARRREISLKCEPEIAALLNQNMEVECLVWDESDDSASKEWVRDYSANPGESFPYITQNSRYRYAKVIHKKQLYLKKASELIAELESNGYTVDNEGLWLHPRLKDFHPSYFQYCGQPATDEEGWPSDWLEER